MLIARSALLVACLLLVRGPAGNAAQTQESYEFVTVSMSVNISVTNLHPLARQVGLKCGARGADAPVIVADLQAIDTAVRNSDPNTYYIFDQKLLSPAHYYRSEAMPQVPVVNGSYSGTLQITVNVPTSVFVDPHTRLVVQDPYVMIGCWLTINGSPAQQSTGQEMVSVGNVNHVIGTPILALANGAVHSK
jgi:hypothetical protein